jgi:hypothetical protein
VQRCRSSHGLPSGFGGSEQRPVAGSQVPAKWHSSRATQTTPSHGFAGRVVVVVGICVVVVGTVVDDVVVVARAVVVVVGAAVVVDGWGAVVVVTATVVVV